MKTPHDRANFITGKHGPSLRALLREAVQLAQSSAPLHDSGRRMVQIIDQVAEKVAPTATCRRGCSHCCRQSVIVTEWEAQRIGRAIGRDPAPVSGSTRTIDTAAADFAGVPCTFLRDGECTVYDVRPLCCRTHFSLGAAELCDTQKFPGGEVPYFNLSSFVMAYGMLFMQSGSGLADIRDFFPEAP